MNIKRIHIKDFRGIEDLELDLVNPSVNSLDLAVFAGPNGLERRVFWKPAFSLWGETIYLGIDPIMMSDQEQRISRFVCR